MHLRGYERCVQKQMFNQPCELEGTVKLQIEYAGLGCLGLTSKSCYLHNMTPNEYGKKDGKCQNKILIK